MCDSLSRYRKKWPGFHVFKAENGHFYAISWNFCIFPIFKIKSNLMSSKIVFWPFYTLWTKIWSKNVSHHHDPKFSVNFSLTSWPRIIFTSNMFTESLGWYLKVSQTCSTLIYLAVSISYGYCSWQIQAWQNIRYLDIDLTCDVTGNPRLATLGLPPKISRSFEHCLNVNWR